MSVVRIFFSRVARKLVFAAGLAILTLVSVLPQQALPPTGMWDKAQHTLAYFMVAAAGLFAFPHSRGRAAVAFGVLAYGGFVEGVQGLIPGRVASLADIAANSLGVGAAFAAGWVLLAVLERRGSS